MKHILYICFWGCLISQTFAQTPETPSSTGTKDQDKVLVEKPENAIYFLSLEKPGRVKRIRFYEGDYLPLTFKGIKERYKAKITKITADQVEVLQTPLDLSKVKSVTLYNTNRLRAMGAIYLPLGGALYFLGDMINPIFSGRDAFQVRTGSVVVPLAMIGSGLVLHALGKRTLKLNKNRYLRILEKI